jgi:beta-glucosidase
MKGPEYYWEDRSGRGLTETGWEVYPKGLEDVMRSAALAEVPIVITENGTAETDDGRKIAYMKDHLRAVHRLIREGIDIRGYFWWSLMDNYEWLEGLRPRFGLYRVDFGTLERRPTAVSSYFTRWVRRRRAFEEGRKARRA